MLRLFVFAAVFGYCAAAQLEEVFGWSEVQFAWPNEGTKQEFIKNGDYIPSHNLPLGLARWKDKLFVTVPRWKSGVAASLSYIPLNTTEKSPLLIPYPDLKANTLPKNGEKLEPNQIVSTFRVHVDACDRLWVLDTGLADILGAPKVYGKPSLTVFDLNTNSFIRKYEFKPTDLTDTTFFPNLVVDVEAGKCDEAFAYVPDLGGYCLVVYSWKADDSWKVSHNFFHFDPLVGDLTIGGVNFQWTDGIFGLSLDKIREDGFRTLYFHPLVSTHEFSVSTEVLRNKTLATDPHSYFYFKVEGQRGNSTQASASALDEETGVMFMTQLTKDGVGCWNTKKPLNPENFGLVAQDPVTLSFPNDLKLDADRNLWVLSDRMQNFVYRKLSPADINYRIFRIKVDDAIVNTPCTN